MSRYDESLFEAPISHESGADQAWEDNQEFEWEHEPGSHYAAPEWESEWEAMGADGELETDAGPAEAAWETASDGFMESLLEAVSADVAAESDQEAAWEAIDESDPFIGKAFKAGRAVAKRLAPLAKKLAPFAARALGSMIPGVGAIAGPALGKLASRVLREADGETQAMEAAFFGANPAQAEVGATQSAHEAVLTELLAAEAIQAESDGEADALLAGSLPITITVMGGRRALLPVLPALAQANGRFVRLLRQQTPAGRQLLAVVPTTQRQAVAILRAAARSGQRISGPLAIQAFAAAAHNVLGNPRRVQRALERNALLQRRFAPAALRRAAPLRPQRASGYPWR